MTSPNQNPAASPPPANAERITIPVIREELEVEKKVVESSGVRVTKHVQERVEEVDLPLMSEAVQVDRVAVNTLVKNDELPRARQEGDTWVIPILEEVVVVEKRIMLKEEVRIKLSREEIHKPQQVVLRSEDVSVERVELPGRSAAAPTSHESDQ